METAQILFSLILLSEIIFFLTTFCSFERDFSDKMILLNKQPLRESQILGFSIFLPKVGEIVKEYHFSLSDK